MAEKERNPKLNFLEMAPSLAEAYVLRPVACVLCCELRCLEAKTSDGSRGVTCFAIQDFRVTTNSATCLMHVVRALAGSGSGSAAQGVLEGLEGSWGRVFLARAKFRGYPQK
jgi:hypothetical protein